MGRMCHTYIKGDELILILRGEFKENMMNLLALYRASNGEIRNLVGWEHWARNFYGSLGTRYEYKGNQTQYQRELEDVMLPDDWFERVKSMLQLEAIGG